MESIGLYFLQMGHHLIHNQQRLIISGCFSDEFAWLITSGELSEKVPSYTTNALEADYRIWRHATQTSATRILVCSPDTDVYNIGLSVPVNKDYIIQLNVHHVVDKKYLILKHLELAFQRDPDLHSIPRENLSVTMQALYISTGCDYVSFFKTFGKASIINNFMQHASFISCGNAVESLHYTNPTNNDIGFLSFLCLVGTCYFKRHISAFTGHETPIQLYNSVDDILPVSERHKIWIKKIRETVSNIILIEEDRVPTYTSLWRHFLRSSWIHQMWQNSTYQDIYSSLLPPEQSGWIKDGDHYAIDWEASEVMERIKGTISFLTKGCSCKKGCRTYNCGCKQQSGHCGLGCTCVGCTNLPVAQPQHHDDPDSSSSSSSDNDFATDSDISSCGEDLETEVITDEFLYDPTAVL